MFRVIWQEYDPRWQATVTRGDEVDTYEEALSLKDSLEEDGAEEVTITEEEDQ